MDKPSYDDPNYLNIVCRYCGEHASHRVHFKDGTSVLTCPTHLKDYVPTVARPPWYGNFCLPAGTHEQVAKVEMWPPEPTNG